MADNIIVNQATSVGATVATEDVAGVQHQKVIVETSSGDGNAVPISAANPMPVVDETTEATLEAILAKIIADPATQTTLAAILAKIISAPSTEAKQDAGNALLTTIAAITQPLTDTQLRASPVPVSISSDIQIGAVELKNGTDDTRATITAANALKVDGSAVTQPVSAASLPLPSGAATSALQGTGNTSIASIDTKTPALGQALAAASTPVVLTAAQVSTLTPQTNALTDAQLRATPVPTHDQVLDDVIGTVGAAAPSKVVLIGAIDASGNVREPLLLNTNNDAQPATDIAMLITSRLFGFNGATWDRLRIDGSDNLQVNVNSALPAGTNNIGDVDVASIAAGDNNIGNVDVVTLPALPAGNNNIGDVDIASIAAGSAIIGKVGIDQTTPGTTNKVSLSDTAGQAQYNFPAGFQRTTDEPRQVFYDPFDKGPLDYVNKWKSPFVTDGGVDAVINGGLVIESSTTANATSYLQSLPSFIPPIPGWLGVSFAIQLEASPITNAYRFWGIGTSPVVPTAAAPLLNAAGFEINTDGKLYAVVYASGVRTVIADLSSSGTNTQPLDGLPHRYIMYYRTDRTFFYFDSLATAVATTNFQGPTLQVLPVKFIAIANSTPPISSAAITCLGVAVWDTAKNSTGISDGTNPFYKAKVNYDGELSVLAGVTAGKNAPFDITGERAMNVKSNELRQTQEEILFQNYVIYMNSISGTRGFELR